MIRLLSAVLMLWFSGTCFAEADAERHKNGCDGGDVFSCALLGSMYQWGDGVGQDSLKAIEYYEKGCDGCVYPRYHGLWGAQGDWRQL